jgi:hypothetical protein
METAAQTFLLGILFFPRGFSALFKVLYMLAIATQGKKLKASSRPFFLCFLSIKLKRNSYVAEMEPVFPR